MGKSTQSGSGQEKGRILAAGGLVWRDPTRRAILVVHRTRYDDWTLPKGKLDDGESFVAAALREGEEETGCTATLDSWAGETFYRVDGRPKSVLFWNMLAREGAVLAPRDVGEVAEARWLTIEEARTRLSHPDERELVIANARG